jgi:hypothetical protein
MVVNNALVVGVYDCKRKIVAERYSLPPAISMLL